MKRIKYITILFAMVTLLSSCNKDEYKFGDIITPSDVKVTSEIVGVDTDKPYGDGSGYVNFTITAKNAITYQISFGDGKKAVAPSGKARNQYAKTGVNKYLVTVTAIGTGGVGTAITTEVEVYSSFSDAEAENLMAGKSVGDTKTWYWAADKEGYAGLGPQEAEDGSDYFGAWWNATPFDETRTCMFNNSFVFSRTDEGITFEQTANEVFVPGAYASVLGVDGDQCYGKDVVPSLVGVKKISFAPSSSKAGTQGTYNEKPYRRTSFTIADNGMMGWYAGSSTYDIVSLNETTMVVRVMQPNSVFAWYHIFTTTKPKEGGSSFTNLVWSDEFDTDGTPDATKWTYDLGAGGWGNGELQTYTNKSENIEVKDGVLKITAKADGSGGYTSARIKTEGLYSFKYGRVEIKAKLPVTKGTWPALWMLGDNFKTIGWPKCGEIDIMEQTGQDKEKVSAATHWFDATTNAHAQYDQNTAVANTATEFHKYAIEWTEKTIKMYVDDKEFYKMENNDKLPFNDKFFFIFNVAVGGTLGGAVASDFTQDVMEVDYIKVYQ